MDLVGFFADWEEQILSDVESLVALESPSTDKQALDRLVHALADMARQAGGEVAIESQESAGDHLVARWGADGGPRFLILSHVDTVWPVGTLVERPWRVVGERAYGPGAYDTKAGAAITLGVMAGLAEMGIAPRYPVTAIFNSDEETGSQTSRALIEREAEDAALVLCMEPARVDGSLKVWRKGTGLYRVVVRGRASHAGGDHESGVNAIEELANHILEIQDMTDYDRGTTTSVGLVSGGSRTNVVPDLAEAWVDLRVKTEAEGARMDAAIKGLEPVLLDAEIIVEGGLSRPPMEESPITLEPFGRLQELGDDLDIPITGSGTGGASDANFTAAMGVPTLDGLGAVGDGAHSVDEYIVIPSLTERAALLAAVLTRW